MKNIKEYTVFISCPNDVAEDRGLIESIVEEYSQKYCPERVQFKTVHLDNVPSKMGKPAQEHINDKIGDYDIYIGLMGARFGSPTEKYESGTVEEFNIAYDKFKAEESVYISFLFKEVNFCNPSENDLTQYSKVLKFKKSIQDDGLYYPYATPESLDKQVVQILGDFLSNHDEKNQYQQYSLITEIPSNDIFTISEEFFDETLNSIDASISNGYKDKITLSDVYVPLDMSIIGSSDDSKNEEQEEIISSVLIEKYKNQENTNIFVTGDEGSGKSTFCKRVFLDFHKNGIVPILLDGSKIKAVSEKSINRLIEKCFLQQYRVEALPNFKALDKQKKLIILDNLDSSSLNNKHKLLVIKKLEDIFNHVIVTAGQFFLFNAHITVPEEHAKFNHYQKYAIEHIGHKLRDELTRKWLLAGREQQLEDDVVYEMADKYGRTIETILGANYVPRRPFVILVLLQGIHSGAESADLTHSSFVRYYHFLIDETLLKRVPKEKIELYYAFLPEVAHLMFHSNDSSFTKERFNSLIDEYSKRKDIDPSDLNNLKGHLITLGMLMFDENNASYRFKHNYTYFYFLGQYFAENLGDPEVNKDVADICQKIHLRENANIIVFLSYHTKDTLIIGTLLDKAESLFSDEDVFDFGKSNTSKLNRLVSQAPKMILQHGREKAEREESLKRQDVVSRKFKGDEDDLNVLDFGEQVILAFRTIEIIGQLLKNHAFKLDAGPKQEMYTKATNLSMRSLNALVDHFLEPEQLIEFIQSKEGSNIESEKEAKEVVFSLAHLIITCFIGATASFTGAEMLRKTYEKSVESNENKAFKLVNLCIGLDHYSELPLTELKQVANDCQTDFLAMSALRSIVQSRLKMRPIQDIKKKQMICDTVGISLKQQRSLESKEHPK